MSNDQDIIEPSIYRYILRHTLKDQIILVVLTGISMPFVYISLDIPKRIINEAIGGVNIPDALFGYPVDQISYLVILSCVFLALVLINGGFKYIINVYSGVVGERMLRRFRYMLYSRILRFPLPHFKRVSQGEIIPMITAETEPLGGFIGESFMLPAFQGGLLLTYLFFIFNQDVILGLAAIALYPPQMYLIPKLQRKVNALAKRRVRAVRTLADNVGESISGVTEIHAHDGSRYERAHIAEKLGRIYHIRFDLFKLKFFIKFLNNFLAQLTPFFFYSVGGYFVIQGELSLGALVAVMAAYKDITSPWKELLGYYQRKEDVRVKHAQIIEQFQPAGMLPPPLQDERPEVIEPLSGTLQASNLSYGEDQHVQAVDGISLSFELSEHLAVVGLNNSGKSELNQLLARLLWPDRGRIRIAETDMATLPEAVTGARIAYAGAQIHIFNGTVADNLIYGLRHRPERAREDIGEDRKQREREIHDATAAANSTDDIAADWIDYSAAGADDAETLAEQAIEVLQLLELDKDAFQLGLYSTVDLQRHPELAESILQARGNLADRLRDPSIHDLIELFDEEKFNTNMSVGKNLLFGTALDETFSEDKLSTNPVVLEVLRETGLYADFVSIGRTLAETMVELFADVDPDSDLFERFSFINADDLPTFRSLLAKPVGDLSPVATGRVTRLIRAVAKRPKLDTGSLTEKEQQLLLALPFKLIPARHRLGLIDDPLRLRVVEARKLIQARTADTGQVEAFDPERFNSALSVQDNVLFGRVAYGQAHAEARVGELIRDTVEQLGLRHDIILAGLDYRVGIGGSRLSPTYRQMLGLARCLLKKPDLLIVNEATSLLDPGAETRVLQRIVEHMQGRGLIWSLGRPELASHFDKVVVVERGRVAAQGTYAELADSNAEFQSLLKAG